MIRCEYCGREIAREEAFQHTVKTGYSVKEFPSPGYKETRLCIDCLERHKKKEKIFKFVSLLILILIVGLIVKGWILLAFGI